MIHLRTLQLGPDELLVATKVDIDAPDIAALAAAIDAIEVRIRSRGPDRPADLHRARPLPAPTPRADPPGRRYLDA